NPQPPPAQTPTFLHKSIWDVAADKSLYTDASHPAGGAAPSPDQIWHMFRSLYLDAKQTTIAAYTEKKPTRRDPTGGNCRYWDNPNAHVKRPFAFDSVQAVADEAQRLTTNYQQAYCRVRVAQWVSELAQACPSLANANPAFKASISADLT